MGRFGHIKIGETGYLYLFDADKTVIFHPDGTKIMKRAGDNGSGAFMDRAIAGYEGSIEVVNSKNMFMLASVKRLRKTGWFLAAYYPAQEAYAPIYAAKKYFLGLLATGIGLTTLLTWLFMKKHLSSLMHLSRQIREIGADVLHSGPLPVPQTGDEVAMLGNAFNDMHRRLKDWGGLVEKTNEELSIMNAFNRNLINSSLDMIIAVDKNRNIIEFNTAAEKTFGYRKEEVAGKHMSTLCQDPEAGAEVGRQIREQGRFSGEIVNRKKSGETFPVYLSAACLYDAAGDLTGVMGISRDITEQKRAEEELRQVHELLKKRASTDALTGIYNRFTFEEMLELEITRAQRYKTPLSLIMFDIDHFKQINDTFGHQAGDGVLKDMAQMVCTNLRLHDVFARWGGEEFMILIPNNDREQTRLLAEKLRELISGGFESGMTVTCSFGVAQLRSADTFETFTQRVDAALYRAKEKGRDRIELEA
jgi:diguanylate cyclase (GGDEF)-like protein/PAS domain S-box-containing protein